MRVVALGSTWYFYFSTRRFSTGASFTLAGTPAIHAYENESDTQITAGITISADADTVTGLNRVTVVATAANGYEAGKVYTFTIGAGTVDSVSVVGTVVYEARVETAAELAAREFNEKLFPNHVIATTTSNDTTHINLAEIVDADTDDDEINGEILAAWDATDGQIILVRVTDYVKATTLATVETLRNGVMPFTVAAGDMVWRYGQYSALNSDLADMPTVSTILTTQMTESYAADNTAATLAQALYMIQQTLTEFAVSSTTMTVKKIDGSTTAATFTLNDATTPTSITRAT